MDLKYLYILRKYIFKKIYQQSSSVMDYSYLITNFICRTIMYKKYKYFDYQ